MLRLGDGQVNESCGVGGISKGLLAINPSKLELDVIVRSKRAGLVPGRTLNISEFGLSAILPVELSVGEAVELDIKLPFVPASVGAVVRNRNVFRHGFEFEEPIRFQ
jgi:hypothetical protein